MAPRDSTATKERIMRAAIDEFTAYGLAGGRIDRIAEASGANKRSIYVYFGDKEGLFHAALHHVLSEMIAAVPLTEDDLAGYAGRLFDYGLEHPQALRLSAWRQLERPDAGPDDRGLFARKVEAMASSRSQTAASGFNPTDLIVLVNGLTWAWMNSPAGLLSADGSDPTSPERIASHRAAVVEAARRLCEPARVPAG